MFEKVPYGVKVRVRGNEKDGFVAEYALHCSRFLSFFTEFADDWKLISRYTHTPVTRQDTFPTLVSAREAAMAEYDGWIKFYERAEETKRVAKSQRKVVWKHP